MMPWVMNRMLFRCESYAFICFWISFTPDWVPIPHLCHSHPAGGCGRGWPVWAGLGKHTMKLYEFDMFLCCFTPPLPIEEATPPAPTHSTWQTSRAWSCTSTCFRDSRLCKRDVFYVQLDHADMFYTQEGCSSARTSAFYRDTIGSRGRSSHGMGRCSPANLVDYLLVFYVYWWFSL